MVEKTETFADRFEQLRGERSYEALSDDIAKKTRVRISAQAMHKWATKNGGITLENARAIASYFDVSPAWLLFGDGPGPRYHLTEAIQDLPEEAQQQVFDFIGYKFERAEGLIASDKLSNYLKMIQRFKDDLDGRKGRP